MQQDQNNAHIGAEASVEEIARAAGLRATTAYVLDERGRDRPETNAERRKRLAREAKARQRERAAKDGRRSVTIEGVPIESALNNPQPIDQAREIRDFCFPKSPATAIMGLETLQNLDAC